MSVPVSTTPPLFGDIKNLIGERGGSIFWLAITNYKAFAAPLFTAAFLGDKWPCIDFYVELTGVQDSTPYFFVQVKTTAKQLPPKARTIPIEANLSKTKALFGYPAPTYIAAVHEPTGRVFIRSIHVKPTKELSSVSIKNELTSTNLKAL